eukprot:3432774-Ditylum_brightwellii.AAC.1
MSLVNFYESCTLVPTAILSKLSTVAWHDLYNVAINDVIVNTTPETKAQSNHFYSSLCSCLYGEALNMMDNKMTDYCEKGVEFLRAMIPGYHPQWLLPEHIKKQAAFYTMFHQNE